MSNLSEVQLAKEKMEQAQALFSHHSEDPKITEGYLEKTRALARELSDATRAYISTVLDLDVTGGKPS